MYVMKSSEGESFTQGNVTPFGNIEMSPYAGILNYGQVSTCMHSIYDHCSNKIKLYLAQFYNLVCNFLANEVVVTARNP